jgi:hypothetical protein
MTQWKFGGERRISDEERREALNIVDAIGDVEAQTGSNVQGVVLTEAEIEALLAVAPPLDVQLVQNGIEDEGH